MWTLTAPVGDNANMKEKLRKSPPSFAFTRRRFSSIFGVVALFLSAANMRSANAQVRSPLNFGLTPVFLTNDLELLTKLKAYLSRKTGREVQLVQRRTYEEITASVAFRSTRWCMDLWLSLCAISTTIVVDRCSGLAGQATLSVIFDCTQRKGRYQLLMILKVTFTLSLTPTAIRDILVTASLLAERKLRPDQFFRKIIFTYGHRNVVRAVASGLAQSGSVDGYVWEVMSSIEPELTAKTEIVAVSEPLGFPPIACLKNQRDFGRC